MMSDVMKDGHRYHEQKRDQIGPSKKKHSAAARDLEFLLQEQQ
jgi:hypothetical protein